MACEEACEGESAGRPGDLDLLASLGDPLFLLPCSERVQRCVCWPGPRSPSHASNARSFARSFLAPSPASLSPPRLASARSAPQKSAKSAQGAKSATLTHAHTHAYTPTHPGERHSDRPGRRPAQCRQDFHSARECPPTARHGAPVPDDSGRVASRGHQRSCGRIC